MKIKAFLLVFAVLYILTDRLLFADSENGAKDDLEKDSRSYYSYLLTSSEKETEEVKKQWAAKYEKRITHKKFSEIPIRLVFSQGKKPDCVPTCIAMVCDYYNVKREPQWMIGRRIRSRYAGKTTGTSVYNTVKEFKNVGLKACAYSSGISDLKEKIEAGTPVIVFQKYRKDIEGGHARIVIGYNDMNSEFTVIDPNFGNKKCYVKYKNFLELWDSMANCAILAFK